jgi:hypothetical protein
MSENIGIGSGSHHVPSPMIIKQIIKPGNTACVKIIVYKHIKTEVDILPSA